MSIKTFWMILIKILGLLLILSALTIIPQWLSSLYGAYQGHDNETFIALLIIFLFIVVVYIFVFKFCVYKTSWIIDKLKLDKGFEDETIQLNSNSNKIISIAIIVIGALMLVESIPVFLRQLFMFFQQDSLFKDYPQSGWMIFNFLKVLMGYLLMTNSFRIAQFVNRKK